MPDRKLANRRHLESLRKYSIHVAHPAWYNWMGRWSRNAVHISRMIVQSTAEHCVPVWSRCVPNQLIDSNIDDALRIVAGCLRPTTSNNLLVEEIIQFSAELHGGEKCKQFQCWRQLCNRDFNLLTETWLNLIRSCDICKEDETEKEIFRTETEYLKTCLLVTETRL